MSWETSLVIREFPISSISSNIWIVTTAMPRIDIQCFAYVARFSQALAIALELLVRASSKIDDSI